MMGDIFNFINEELRQCAYEQMTCKKHIMLPTTLCFTLIDIIDRTVTHKLATSLATQYLIIYSIQNTPMFTKFLDTA